MSEPIIAFQRYEVPDRASLEGRLQADLEALAVAQAQGDEESRLKLLGNIGAKYTLLWREAEAEPFLSEALDLSRNQHNQALEVSNSLRLATAWQYLNRRAEAYDLFLKTLQLIEVYQQSYYLDFALQHLGRCLVELGRVDEAIEAFEQALALRKANGNQELIESSQRALEAARLLREK